MTMEAEAWVVMDENMELTTGVMGRKTITTRTEAYRLIAQSAHVWVLTGVGVVDPQLV